ncbi:CHRD domain-containing protein [Haloferula sargassicola]|uniref:CHRD domain-containing protein n=1 Tax=Haloferula sargassicola TaxID=490096 RepID=A0ABP9UWB0_9BACT
MKHLPSQSLRVLAFAGLLGAGSTAGAAVIQLDFMGTAGTGLLPGNENPAAVSPAFGSEIGAGLFYDDTSNTLTLNYTFESLTGGIDTSIASGMHLHDAGAGSPFTQNGGIVFNLNSGIDTNVALTTPLIANGATSGTVSGTISLSEAQEAALLDSRFYLNIHSASFGGGELRANLVPVPEPSTILLGALAGLGFLRRRRR